MSALWEAFSARAGSTRDLVDLVLAISRIPYGRPHGRPPGGVVDEWRGTCSGKHLLLSVLAAERWPSERIRLWHRPYVVTRELASSRWGPRVADVVPEGGLIDVHTFATIERHGRRLLVDVTFPVERWDGRTDTALWCGEGADVDAGTDPLATKAALVAEHGSPDRERFIEALAALDAGAA